MSTTITQTQENIQSINDSVKAFMTMFKVGELLRTCNAKKVKGYPIMDVFTYIICQMFSQISTYMSMKVGTYKEEFRKNTIYRLCNDSIINWHKFLMLLSERIIRTFVRPATSDGRVEYFIFDDTPFSKSGKKTELVSKFFNHVNMHYEYGYRILTLLWSDEYTNIPIDFCPLASSNPDLIRYPAKQYDMRTIAGRNRAQAKRKAPDIIVDMLKKAINAGHSAKYVLFDSWFATPKGITAIKNRIGLDVIAMVKKSSKVFYEYNGKCCDIKQIYSSNRKRCGKSKYLVSVDVNLIQKDDGVIVSRIPAKIVCVRNKANRKDWIAIISTDMDISENEIIRRYGTRWNIEVYFKTCKQYLKLLKECNSPSFDAFTCHLAIVNVRYMMLSVYERSNSDDRTVGELFWMYAAEVAELEFDSVMTIIVTALLESVKEYFKISDEEMQNFVINFVSKLPENLKSSLLKSGCLTVAA